MDPIVGIGIFKGPSVQQQPQLGTGFLPKDSVAKGSYHSQFLLQWHLAVDSQLMKNKESWIVNSTRSLKPQKPKDGQFEHVRVPLSDW
jgi:hypothetical protein